MVRTYYHLKHIYGTDCTPYPEDIEKTELKYKLRDKTCDVCRHKFSSFTTSCKFGIVNNRNTCYFWMGKKESKKT